MNQNLRVNKTNFHMKDFALGLALKQRRKATQKSPIHCEVLQVKSRDAHALHSGHNQRLLRSAKCLTRTRVLSVVLESERDEDFRTKFSATEKEDV